MNRNSVGKAIALTLLAFVLMTPVFAGAQVVETRYTDVEPFTQEELAQMLAPIALYPDPLLSQILIASSYPFEVVEAERWVTRNAHLSGHALDSALMEKDWDMSVLALCHYPKVLSLMTDNLSWTVRLGDAFVNQEQDLMDSVQELRYKASQAGHLSSTREQKVIVEQRIIRIEPISHDYIYVPSYDPYVIYGSWWLPGLPPFVFFYPGVVVTGPRIVFSPRIYVRHGYVAWSNFNWRERHVVIVNVDRRPHTSPRTVIMRRDAPRVIWQPDRDRRQIREVRSKDLPAYRQPTRPPRRVIEVDRTRSGERAPVVSPRTAPQPRPRVLEPQRQQTPAPPAAPRVRQPDRPRGSEDGTMQRDRLPVPERERTRPDSRVQPAPQRERVSPGNVREGRSQSPEPRGGDRSRPADAPRRDR